MENFGRGLSELHDELRQKYPALCRVAVAVYDKERDFLKTFHHSTDGESPLSFYQVKLNETPSLKRLVETGESRVVDNLQDGYDPKSEHSRRLIAAGLGSSLTIPIYNKDQFFGFLFFNSREAGYFKSTMVEGLTLYSRLISVLAIQELMPIEMLKGAVETVREFSRHRDAETAAHIDRMSRYARLIALEMGPKFNLQDEFVEYLFRFAPLHDVGKVAIPDNILLKEGKLTEEEFTTMQSHVSAGLEMINSMVNSFGLATIEHVEMLRNIVGYHHEAYDGSGYIQGLKGDEIPLESRITAVADVFDALTSKRPYKEAWPNDEAFAYLERNAGTKFDKNCVDALLCNLDRVEQIQALCKEQTF
ncbi:MAG: HD domain-containing protein [Rhodospirillales bacterium]|nr:HD domain-containing protein [Rhodospirillales bacterium]